MPIVAPGAITVLSALATPDRNIGFITSSAIPSWNSPYALFILLSSQYDLNAPDL